MPVAAALPAHTLIGFDQEDAFIRALRSRGLAFGREAFALRTDNHLGQLALLRAGAGIGVCQTGIAVRDGLVRVLPEVFALELELWVVMHEDLKADRHCRVVLDALAGGLAGYVRSG